MVVFSLINQTVDACVVRMLSRFAVMPCRAMSCNVMSTIMSIDRRWCLVPDFQGVSVFPFARDAVDCWRLCWSEKEKRMVVSHCFIALHHWMYQWHSNYYCVGWTMNDDQFNREWVINVNQSIIDWVKLLSQVNNSRSTNYLVGYYTDVYVL